MQAHYNQLVENQSNSHMNTQSNVFSPSGTSRGGSPFKPVRESLPVANENQNYAQRQSDFLSPGISSTGFRLQSLNPPQSLTNHHEKSSVQMMMGLQKHISNQQSRRQIFTPNSNSQNVVAHEVNNSKSEYDDKYSDNKNYSDNYTGRGS